MKIVVCFFLAIAMIGWAASSAHALEPNFENCADIAHPESLVAEYVALWVDPNSDVPVVPNDMMSVDALAVRNAKQVRFAEVRHCLLDYSFADEGKYLTTLLHIKPLIQNGDDNDRVLQAYFSILMEMNQRWESEMHIRKLMREEDESSSFLMYFGAYAVSLVAVTQRTQLAKAGRFIGKFWGKPAALKTLAPVLRSVGVSLTKPAALRSAAVTLTKPAALRAYGYTGFGYGNSAYTTNDREEEINETISEKIEEPQFQQVTGDYGKKVWSSPIFVVDLAADHSVNEIGSYESFNFLKDLGSIAIGTGFGLLSHHYLKKMIQNKYPIFSSARDLYARTRGIQAGSVGATAGLTLGAVEFGAALAIGVGLYKVGSKLAEVSIDRGREFRLNERFDVAVDSLFGRGEQGWKLKNPMGKSTRVQGIDDYKKSTDQNYETEISALLLDAGNRLKYAAESKARFYRGKAELAQKNIIEKFQGDYVCTGLRYQTYYFDWIDRENGLSFDRDHLFLPKEQAEELYSMGNQELDTVRNNFRHELFELEAKLKVAAEGRKPVGTMKVNPIRNKYLDIQRSLKAYDDAIQYLQQVIKKTGRNFLMTIVHELHSAKMRDIYNFSARSLYNTHTMFVEVEYQRSMADQSSRHDGTCWTQSMEQFWYRGKKVTIDTVKNGFGLVNGLMLNINNN